MWNADFGRGLLLLLISLLDDISQEYYNKKKRIEKIIVSRCANDLKGLVLMHIIKMICPNITRRNRGRSD